MKVIKSVLLVLLITALGTFTAKSQTINRKDSDIQKWALTPPMGWTISHS